MAEKWGYVWGTFGQILTDSLLQQKIKQYPRDVGSQEAYIRTNYMGKRTADCIGLIKSYMWWSASDPVYMANTDVNADMMFDIAIEKGTINTLPELPGACLWKLGHIGVYIGSGQVIEAHGTKYGVIQTPLYGQGATAWTHWLNCPFLQYIAPPEHWAEGAYLFLKEKGIVIHEKRFDDVATRGDMFTMLARTIGYRG